jgi:toluene monooxygenase system ferredoxin subunit
MAYRRVAALTALWKGDMMGAVVDGRKVLVIRSDDAVLAYEDRCAHLGVALSEGRLDGCVLTCAAHHWQYDVATGRGINPSVACLKRFDVLVEHDVIYVDVEPAPGAHAGGDRT